MAELLASVRSALACWPALIVGTALYALAASVCALGLFALQHDLGLEQAKSGPPADARTAIQGFVSAAFAAAAPDPGAPLSPALSALRDVLSREDRATVNRLAVHIGSGAAGVTLHTGAPSAGAWFAVVCGVILMLLSEWLLRFRSVAAVAAAGAETPNRRLRSCLYPLAQSARLGIRHWRQVAVHGTCLQSVSVLVCVAGIALPQTLEAYIGIGSSGPCLLNPFLQTLAAGMSTAAACLPALILAAFGAVYEARLYRALLLPNQPLPPTLRIEPLP